MGGSSGLSLLLAVLIAVSMYMSWSQLGDRAERAGATPVQSQTQDQKALDQKTSSSVGFTSPRSLDDHFEKHGAEFGSISKAQYLALAKALRDVAPGGPVLEAVRKDGVITRFDKDSGAFIAFNPDRTIRTFFRPNDGERYFRRQAARDTQ